MEQALLISGSSHTEPIEAHRSVTRTFAFIDVVGSTRLIDAIGDAAWVRLLSWHERELEHLFAHHQGELVDQAGDGFFVSFVDPCAAIDCAVAIQRLLAHHRRRQGFALDFRIGLHRAEVLRCGLAYRGKGVHVGARIAAQASAGEILASRETVQAARASVPASRLRTVILEGISEPIQLLQIKWTRSG